MTNVSFATKTSADEIITYSEILSNFTIYRSSKRYYTFILIPNTKTDEFGKGAIVANETGIRICKDSDWTNKLVNFVCTDKTCNSNKLIEVSSEHIPQDIQSKLCLEIVKQFKL